MSSSWSPAHQHCLDAALKGDHVSKEIEDMARDLAMKGYAARTQVGYLRTAKKLEAHFKRPVGELSRDELRGFVEALQAQGKSASWLNGQLCALRFLYRKTLGRPELVSFISLPRVHSPLPQVLSQKEVHSLLNAIQNPRYQAIAMVMYGAGLRIAEVRVLEVRDIDGERGVIRVRHGKGDKAREAKLSPSLYSWLRDYWRREQPAAPYLFASKSGQLPPQTRSGMPSARQQRMRGSRNASRLMSYGTALPRTCSKRERTCMWSVPCWVMPASARRLATLA
jgi:site-specific recombinase XerD